MFTLRNINMALTMSQCYGAEGEPTTRRVQKTFACPRPTASIFKITATNQKTGLVNAFNQASILCENYSSELCRSLLEVSMEPQYEKVGRITHFYSKPSVAVAAPTASRFRTILQFSAGIANSPAPAIDVSPARSPRRRFCTCG